MIDKYTTDRGEFDILVEELNSKKLDGYDEYRVGLGIKVENITNPDWEVLFAPVNGKIKSLDDMNRLLKKCIEIIKNKIDLDINGEEIVLNEEELNLTK
ncbi:MAG: hypothetical protein GF365_02590 [Candidatus Buchananbacteria bacterium]|nr:hypothetical protein [Candidatus Buchananbacteria bacterium]